MLGDFFVEPFRWGSITETVTIFRVFESFELSIFSRICLDTESCEMLPGA